MTTRLTIMATLAAAALFSGGYRLRAADPITDETLLKRHLGSADPERVAIYLNNLILTEPAKADLKKLILQMGDRKFALRQEASRKLAAAGQPALSLLREAMQSSDKEIATRAKRCIDEIETGEIRDLPGAAVRHVVRLRHEKTVEALLTASAAGLSEDFNAEVLQGLRTVSISGTTIHPALVLALDDPQASRRAIAVQILADVNDRDIRKKIVAKLSDPDGAVRYQAAIGLYPLGDRGAVPVLIDSIDQVPSVAIWQHCEECLYALAGELAPHIEVGKGDLDDRKRIAEQWRAWWKARGEQVLLGQKDDRPNDIAVVADTSGRVWEWQPDGKPRFSITGLTSPVDARVLPGRRVLIAEEAGQKVSEYSFNGRLLWERSFDEGPVSVQRLPNGNTFVATYFRVHEVRRDGSVASTFDLGDNRGRISDANKLPSGGIVCLFNDNTLVFFGRDGKARADAKMDSWGGVDALKNGHVLVSQIQANKIAEVDGAGKVIWEFAQPGIWVGTRLPDGNTLVASKKEQKMYKVDPKGKILWEKPVDGHPHAMHWR
jgi:hypothetical protein